MADDLVERLRKNVMCGDAVIEEAASRIEKLEAALIDILKVPRSEASWGIALVIAHHALKEEGKDD
jgi:hypothetical protein